MKIISYSIFGEEEFYRKGYICIHIHYNLGPGHITALLDGWKNADTNKNSIDYWKMLFNDSYIALNEIRHKYRIQIKSKSRAEFHSVPILKKIAGYITIDYS